jgi:hypothetical protein
VSGFQSGLAGTSITWAGGVVRYYTDLGSLSPVLPQADADALVANAFAPWTSVPTAALAAIREGQLAEDVSGATVSRAGGTLVMPADIQPGSSKPLAVIYDADGQVTDALLGVGAGDAALCSTNAAFGGPDAFTEDAHIAHATLVLNGNCAQQTSDIPILRYRLVRMLGSVLGLDWAQVNDNVLTGTPAPTLEDYAGWPVMHPLEVNCGGSPLSCLPEAEQLRMDDRAAVSRLYPVTAANLGMYTGKQVFAESTARISGTVRFADPAGVGMQGVNVVARRLDLLTGRASRRYAASCVSGFLLRGNGGNAVTGYQRATGEAFDHFGSDDPAKQGWFDLAGLEIPEGETSARYEISVEPINPLYDGASAVGPYREGPVSVSGSAPPAVVTVTRGAAVVQDIIMSGSASDTQDAYEPNSFAAPAEAPAGGEWTGSLSPYGDEDYHALYLRGGRTVAVEVTAIDENSAATTRKAQPVIGLWRASDAEGTAPALKTTAFNAVRRGMTRLAAQFTVAGGYTIGIADYRGDGRPDFRYRARVLYGDTVSPARVSVLGGTTLTISGLGFRPSVKVAIGGVDAPVVTVSSTELQVTAPPLADGPATIVVSDPITGGSTTMTDALTAGAVAGDGLVLVAGANPGVPVGAQAPNPIRVRVVDANGAPVAGATVTFTASPESALAFLPCAASCTYGSDALGEVSVNVVVKQLGASTATATLPGGASVSTTLEGISGTLQIAATMPKFWVAAHARLSLPLTARVLENAVAAAGRTVNYQLTGGEGLLSTGSATTGANGEAVANLNVSDLRGDVRVSACVAGTTVCTSFVVLAVAPADLKLEKLSGDEQVTTVGQALQPISVRVTDSSVPANPVLAAPVKFTTTAFRRQQEAPRIVSGETVTTYPAQPVPVGTTETIVLTDAAGLAALAPAFPAAMGALKVEVTVSTGKSEAEFAIKIVWPIG